MIRIVEGNILDATEDIIGHQVNCRGVMGAGLAKQIRNKYPKAYDEYIKLVHDVTDKTELLGKCQFVKTDDGKVIANIFGQLNYGRGERQTNYIALEKGLNELKDKAVRYDKSVALPFGIGCGLAGGDWEIVEGIIDRVFENYEVTSYKFK